MSDLGGLFFDTDVLIQLFISRSQNILGHLRDDFGIQGVVLAEVVTELGYSRKFGTRFQKDLRRACQAGWLCEMDVKTYATIVNSSNKFQKAATGISFSDIELLGREYNYRIDRGEAYTLAAAVLLSQPAASNDMSAISVLETNGYQIPVPTLRTFDIIALAYQTDFKSKSDCDKIRRLLLGEGERIPPSWTNASFEVGLQSFVPRIVDSSCKYVGAINKSKDQNHYTTPLTILRA